MTTPDFTLLQRALSFFERYDVANVHQPEEQIFLMEIMDQKSILEEDEIGKEIVRTAQQLLDAHHHIDSSNSVSVNFFSKKDELTSALRSFIKKRGG